MASFLFIFFLVVEILSSPTPTTIGGSESQTDKIIIKPATAGNEKLQEPKPLMKEVMDKSKLYSPNYWAAKAGSTVLETAYGNSIKPTTPPSVEAISASASASTSTSTSTSATDTKTSTSTDTSSGNVSILEIYVYCLITTFLVTALLSCKRLIQRQREIASLINGTGTGTRGNMSPRDFMRAMHMFMRNGGSDNQDDHNGHPPDLRRMAAILNMSRRDLSPDDYELLSALDGNGNGGNDNAHEGLEEGTIRRFPIRKITKHEIESSKASKTSSFAGTADTGGTGSRNTSSSDLHHMEAGSSINNNTNAGCDDDFQCSICLAPYEVHDEVRTLLCLHSYHVDCIDPWLRENSACPICKMHMG